MNPLNLDKVLYLMSCIKTYVRCAKARKDSTIFTSGLLDIRASTVFLELEERQKVALLGYAAGRLDALQDTGADVSRAALDNVVIGPLLPEKAF